MGQDTSEIREQIATEREELGETVKALAQKADVKGRVQKKASESAEQLQQKAGEVAHKVHDATPDPVLSGVQTASDKARQNPVPVLAAVILLAIGAFVGWRLRRSG